MLRRLYIGLCGALVLCLSACFQEDITSLSQKEIYFFYQNSCPHCHTAADYIKSKHPNIKIKSLDVSLPGNMRLLQSAAKSYNIGAAVGTPLICFGHKYIMGWSSDDESIFDELAEKYEP